MIIYFCIICCFYSMQKINLDSIYRWLELYAWSILEMVLWEMFTRTPLIIKAFNGSPPFHNRTYWYNLICPPAMLYWTLILMKNIIDRRLWSSTQSCTAKSSSQTQASQTCLCKSTFTLNISLFEDFLWIDLLLPHNCIRSLFWGTLTVQWWTPDLDQCKVELVMVVVAGYQWVYLSPHSPLYQLLLLSLSHPHLHSHLIHHNYHYYTILFRLGWWMKWWSASIFSFEVWT